MPYSRRKVRVILLSVGCAILFCCLAVTSFTVSQQHQLQRLAPAGALAQGVVLTGSAQYDKAKWYFEHALDSRAVAPWALYYLGVLEEKSGHKNAARAKYRSVPATSAASLDARVALLRLAVEEPQFVETAETGSAAVEQLEFDVRRAVRDDLSKEFQLAVAHLTWLHSDPIAARAQLQALRRSAAGREIGKRARALSDAIPAPAVEPTAAAIAPVIEEARLRQMEGDPQGALQLLETALPVTAAMPKEHFEALLAREEALRASGGAESADMLLTDIARTGPVGAGDVALLKLLKSAWNRDDVDGVVEHASRLLVQFPQSPLVVDTLSIKGQTLAEAGRVAEAETTFLEGILRAPNPVAKLKFHRQLAWLFWRAGSLERALAAFQQGVNFGDSALETIGTQIRDGYSAKVLQTDVIRQKLAESRALYRDLVDETMHARYWLAVATLEAKAKLKPAAASFPAPEMLLRSILTTAPNTYYALRAAETLHQQPLQDMRVPVDSELQCVAPVQEPLSTVLHDLESLPELAQRELDYGLRNDPDSSALDAFLRGLNGERPLLDGEFRRVLTLIALSERFGLPHRGVSLAEVLWKRPRNLDLFSEGALSCFPALHVLAFPRQYSDIFAHEADESGTPASLLFAVARTESFFAPEARSAKNALGLMQLLPETARQFGLQEKESLLEPAVNIRVGSRLLAKLLKEHPPVELAAATYNAGPKAVAKWLGRMPADDPVKWVEIISFPETRDYVRKVALAKAVYERLAAPPPTPSPSAEPKPTEAPAAKHQPGATESAKKPAVKPAKPGTAKPAGSPPEVAKPEGAKPAVPKPSPSKDTRGKDAATGASDGAPGRPPLSADAAPHEGNNSEIPAAAKRPVKKKPSPPPAADVPSDTQLLR